MRRITLLALMLTVTLVSFSQNIGNTRYRSESWKDNWEISFGGQMSSFSGESMSFDGCLDNNRLSSGVFASVGKWVTPFIQIRTEFDGIWAKYGVFGLRNKYFQMQEVAGFSLLDIIGGYKEKRFYNIVPFIGGGYYRGMTFNENKLCWSAGVDQTFRINDIIKLRVGLGVGDGGGYNADHLTGRLGFSIALGNQGWTKYKRKFRPYHGKEVVRYDKKKFDSDAFDYSYVRGIGNKVNKEPLPEGMSLIRRGTVVLGVEVPDSMYIANSLRKSVSVNDFWMDEKEVTNAKWRQFVEDVKKQVIARKTAYMGDSVAAAESLYRIHGVTGKRVLDVSQLNYVFHIYNYQEAMKPKYRSEDAYISKDTAWIDLDGEVHSKVIKRKRTGDWDFLNTYVVNVYPDTTCWVNDYPNSSNGIFSKYYFNDGAYDNFPVVGVDWMQANAFCYWRTELLAKKLGVSPLSIEPYRLPTEAEFEYAARGLEGNEYPWEKKKKQDLNRFANFKNGEGDYVADGNLITCEVGKYKPNGWGLYDMAGNVAEWTAEMFYEYSQMVVNEINPELKYNAVGNDIKSLKRKAIRGGSWKDNKDRIRSAWRTWEYQDRGRSYIGLRCVRSLSTAVR